MLETWLREHGTLEAAAARHPDAEVLAGRGRVYVVPAPTVDAPGERGADERWVVRHYHRGGAIASLLGDRYLRVGRPRPFRELAVGRAVEARGVPTPVHIGAAVYRSGIWYRGDLVTRYVPVSRDLAAVLFPGRTLGSGPLAGSRARMVGTSSAGASAAGASRDADPVAAMTAAGRLFRRIHEGGVDHPDLNLKNVLIRGTGAELEALVLDLDSATVTPEPERAPVREAARGRMIARFWRSARKWERATGIDLDAALRAAFEMGYAARAAG